MRPGADPGAAPLRYLALGDSLATGAWPGIPRPRQSDLVGRRLAGVPAAWFDHPEGSYPARAAGLLAARGPVELARATACAGAMRAFAPGGRAWPALRAGLARDPDLVTVSFGANDLLGHMARAGANPFAMRWAALLWRVPPGRWLMRRTITPERRRRGLDGVSRDFDRLLGGIAAPGRRVVLTTYPVGDGGPELRDDFLGPLNACIRAAADRHGAEVLDLEFLFLGHDRRRRGRERWISRVDGIHPTARGHLHIARALVALHDRRPAAALAGADR